MGMGGVSISFSVCYISQALSLILCLEEIPEYGQTRAQIIAVISWHVLRFLTQSP